MKRIFAKKRLISILLITVMALTTVLCLSSCSKYKEKWIMGKTSSEIIEKYGEFDYIRDGQQNEEGNYYSCGCAYKTKDRKDYFLYSEPAEYYMIYFDEKGKVYQVKEEWTIPD